MVSRRRFLALGPVLAATAASGPQSIVQEILPRAPRAESHELTRSTFAPHLSSEFTVHVGSLRRVEARLVEVADLPQPGASAADREGRFVLRVTAARAEAFGQDTYDVQHPRLGRFALFLVPVGESGDVRHYEAVFNRLGATPAREA